MFFIFFNLLLLLAVEELYLNNHKANKHDNLHVCIYFSGRVYCLVIFSLTPFLVLLIVIRTMHYNGNRKRNKHLNLHVLRFYWLCLQHVVIFLLSAHGKYRLLIIINITYIT